MSRIEKGVMVMKDGKAWGKTYEDGYCTAYGWIEPEQARIHNPKYCTKTTDVTHSGSQYTEELKTGELVLVERLTTVTIVGV